MTESEARKGKKRHLPVVPPSPEPLPSYETSYEPAIAIATIRPSPTNPRKRFDDLQDLAASISAQGVIVPIQVRPRPRPDGTLYELVCGERRWRASQLAGLTTIKAEVIDLPDDVVIERQIIENVQRHDVDPLDEAFGFRVLRDAGRDVDYIAAKTGKSRAWVYARLKLCDLSEPIREHLASGKLSPSVALLLARIPDPAMQEWAAREVLRLDPQEVKRVLEGEDEGRQDHLDRLYDLRDQAPHVGGGDTGEPAEVVPMSVREATEHLQRYYMTRLEAAPFSLSDETLPGGSCTSCVHRTGNQLDLFGDVKRPDVCTAPSCFAAKKRAAFEREAAAAAQEGARVLTEEEAKKVFHPYIPDRLMASAPYVKLEEEVPWDLLSPAQHAEPPTWASLLGKKGAAALPKVLAQDPTGGRHDLVDKAAAVQALREAGKLPKPKEHKAEGNRFDADEAKRKQQVERAKRALGIAATGAVVHARKVDVERDPAFWRWLLGLHVADAGDLTLQLVGVKTVKDLEGAIAKAKTVAELRAILVVLLLGNRGVGWTGKPDPDVVAGLKLFKVDWAKCLASASKDVPAAKKSAASARSGKGKPATKAKS